MNVLSLSLLRRRRFQVVTAILILQAAALLSFTRDEVKFQIPPLQMIPERLENWSEAREGVIEKEAMSILQPDDYLVRDYYDRSSGRFANLFIAYFKSQRSDRMPHSPRNCLPGNGWVPSGYGSTEVQVPGQPAPIRVNNYTVRKGDERAIVLYWYQTWKRSIASEYQARVYLALDSIRDNRTDTALVRVMVPVPEDAAPDAYQAAAVEFVRAVYPRLSPYFPR